MRKLLIINCSRGAGCVRYDAAIGNFYSESINIPIDKLRLAYRKLARRSEWRTSRKLTAATNFLIQFQLL